MRQFKYFASYADVVITVEGWMMHLAYALGRPFRLLMAPYSAHDWMPERRGPDQRLAVSMSPAAAPCRPTCLARAIPAGAASSVEAEARGRAGRSGKTRGARAARLLEGGALEPGRSFERSPSRSWDGQVRRHRQERSSSPLSGTARRVRAAAARALARIRSATRPAPPRATRCLRAHRPPGLGCRSGAGRRACRPWTSRPATMTR
jgi:hypothetical protein